MNAFIQTVAGTTAILFFLSACASTPTAVTDHDPSFDFSSVQRVAILPLNRQVIPQTAVSDMQAGRISNSVKDELERRGYTVTDDSSSADLLMTWHLVTQERTDIRTYNSMSAHYTRCWNCGPSNQTNVRVRQYTQGTMIVDFLNPETNNSVWRSIVEQRIREQTPEQAEQTRAEVAEALFSDFPPN
ncbi:MAG: DUF4136 domain-containing protein [Halioglobus sp.]